MSKMSERKVLEEEEEEAEEEEAGGTSKVRTPHKDVGNYVGPYIMPSPQPRGIHSQCEAPLMKMVSISGFLVPRVGIGFTLRV